MERASRRRIEEEEEEEEETFFLEKRFCHNSLGNWAVETRAAAALSQLTTQFSPAG